MMSAIANEIVVGLIKMELGKSHKTGDALRHALRLEHLFWRRKIMNSYSMMIGR